ncbi:hypothetical protein UYO_20528 [Lachnospiraceae bacterium JC7]|nr:hypothetical protein UYO_20528 [Lachnospiraceae bacterium JC7]
MAVALTASVVMSQGMITYAEDAGSNEATSTIMALTAGEDASEHKSKVTIDEGTTGIPTGIQAISNRGYTSEVTVDGDVKVSNGAGGDVNGIQATAVGKNSEDETDRSTTNVTVGGKLSVTAHDESETANGITAIGSEGGNTNVTVGGELSVTAHDKSKTANGITASGSAGGSTTVNTGDVTVNSEKSATGVKGDAEYNSSTVEINTGDITVGGYRAVGVEATGSASEENDKSSVTINTGDITVTGSNDACGVSSSFEGADIMVDGDVTAISGSGGKAHAIENLGGKITVTGDVSASGGTSDEGIVISSKGIASVIVKGDVTSDENGIYVLGNGENADVYVSVKNLTASGTESTALQVEKKNEESKIDVTVEETLKGEKHNIVIIGPDGNVTDENLDITVWKIDTTATDGVTAETVTTKEVEGPDGPVIEKEYKDISEEAAAVINYIIKVDEVKTKGASLTAADTAKEGEKVFLEVTVPSGYVIDSFYTGEGGTEVDVVKDESGKYYLVVPRGGGVFVGVTLKGDNVNNTDDNDPANNGQSNTPASNESTSDDSSSDNNAKTTTGSGTGDVSNYSPVIPYLKTMTVNGQELEMNIYVTNLNNSLTQAFSDMLTAYAPYGMLDYYGNPVAVPENSVVKDSFSFTAEGVEGFVTAYIEFKNYKEGDIIMCTYTDPVGNMITVAVTPLMVDGTGLILLLPANCNLALAGSMT